MPTHERVLSASDVPPMALLQIGSPAPIRNTREGANLPVGGRQPEINERYYA
jgi:hypothetical protein